jgi:biopolymer transport protein ExbD
MIDVIFFLLVFFMVSTLSMTINRGLPVNLPKAATSQKDLRDSFNITVMQDGMLFLNKEPTTLSALGQRVKTGLEQEPELTVIISGDDQALHGAIVAVLDEVRLAGVSRLAIAPSSPGRGPNHDTLSAGEGVSLLHARAPDCAVELAVILGGTASRVAPG